MTDQELTDRELLENINRNLEMLVLLVSGAQKITPPEEDIMED